LKTFSYFCLLEDSLGLCDCPCYQIDYLLAAFFLTTGYAKYVARLQKMFLLLLIMDLWKSGMIDDSWTMTVTHPIKDLVDAGEDSHFVISLWRAW
jgi:hypothetical protein